MNGKGDTRRPMVIDDKELETNWDNTFNDDKQEDKADPRYGITTPRFDPNRCGYNRRFNR